MGKNKTWKKIKFSDGCNDSEKFERNYSDAALNVPFVGDIDYDEDKLEMKQA